MRAVKNVDSRFPFFSLHRSVLLRRVIIFSPVLGGSHGMTKPAFSLITKTGWSANPEL